MQEVEELVSELCPEDCIYRNYIDGGNTPICYYAVIMCECRGCKISECDKYKPGKPIKVRMDKEYVIGWEREIYDDGIIDAFW